MTAVERGLFRVLVVDDNPGDQMLAAMYLREAWPFEHDMELDFAADGQEALLKLRAKRFVLMVLDWKLPVMGNGEVLRHLRQHGIRLPVVVFSSADREDIADDMDELAAAYLHKDRMNPLTLRSAIAQSLALLGMREATEASLTPPMQASPLTDGTAAAQ
jgi:CheY-like chemotaxis protein